MVYFPRFRIYALIYLLSSDLFHPGWQSLGLSTSRQMAQFQTTIPKCCTSMSVLYRAKQTSAFHKKGAGEELKEVPSTATAIQAQWTEWNAWETVIPWVTHILWGTHYIYNNIILEDVLFLPEELRMLLVSVLAAPSLLKQAWVQHKERATCLGFKCACVCLYVILSYV